VAKAKERKLDEKLSAESELNQELQKKIVK